MGNILFPADLVHACNYKCNGSKMKMLYSHIQFNMGGK